MRLDQFLVFKELCETRNKAAWMIQKGFVKVNGSVINQKSLKIADDDEIEIIQDQRVYVSLGGYKLEKALKKLNFDLSDKIALDVGASTGGFTDCALQHGAKKVIALDVGQNQLHHSLQSDDRVLSLENTDIRNFVPEDHGFKTFEFIMIDVSFISLTKILPILSPLLDADGYLFALFKPQFEQSERVKFKKGIIKSEELRNHTLNEIKKFLIANEFQLHGVVETDVDKKQKNVEYMLLISK